VLYYNITLSKNNRKKMPKVVDILGWRPYSNNINRSKRAGLRQARGREKLLRATGWPKSDL
tara:strand:- start:281 stop:463 length:183 start_codon:yes stop_codon:yes gene_type:complete